MRISVQPSWCLELPLQQQSVLLLASRGPDGIGKYHAAKNIVRAYRGTVFLAAKYGRPLYWGERADTFMTLERMADPNIWKADVECYFDNVDELPHHYHAHLMHGTQILGYKHPDQRFRERWLEFYLLCVKDAHLQPETEEQMDARLSDWNHAFWDQR